MNSSCVESRLGSHYGFFFSFSLFDSTLLATTQIVELATHPYGCRVIQRLLQHATIRQRERLITPAIMGSILNLARDPYGNYVVQNILEYGSESHRDLVLQSLKNKVFRSDRHLYFTIL